LALLTIDHNTIVNGCTLMVFYIGTVWNVEPLRRGCMANFAVEQLTYTNNLAYNNTYGVKGDGLRLERRASPRIHGSVGVVERRARGAGQPYPVGTWLPSVADYQGQFDGDYQLVPGVRISKPRPMADVGVDWTQSLPVIHRPKSPYLHGEAPVGSRRASGARWNTNSLQPSPTPPHFIFVRAKPLAL
jgi:hypothetical protein